MRCTKCKKELRNDDIKTLDFEMSRPFRNRQMHRFKDGRVLCRECMPTPSCFECQHAVIHQGYWASRWDPGQDPGVEGCKALDPHDGAFIEMADDYFELEYEVMEKDWRKENIFPCVEEYLARYCGQFEPKMVESCQHCGKEIGEPGIVWQRWATGLYEGVPVCSNACRKEVEREIEELGVKL